MNKEKIAQFVSLLERQASGDATAREYIHRLDFSLEDSECLFNLHTEWVGAFSFTPGRVEVLPIILSLALKITKYEQDNALALFYESEWQKLVTFRGPVATVLIHQCLRCRKQYPSMGTSGFDEISSLVCPKCGDVYFKSYHDDDQPPCPNCSALLPGVGAWGCPNCKSKEYRTVTGISPYEYFSKHSFKRRGV